MFGINVLFIQGSVETVAVPGSRARGSAERSGHLVDSPSRFCAIREPTIFSKGRARASLPGSLAASDALGSARSGFEATPVVDADHGVSES